jgi:hypothetical protein
MPYRYANVQNYLLMSLITMLRETYPISHMLSSYSIKKYLMLPLSFMEKKFPLPLQMKLNSFNYFIKAKILAP